MKFNKKAKIKFAVSWGKDGYYRSIFEYNENEIKFYEYEIHIDENQNIKDTQCTLDNCGRIRHYVEITFTDEDKQYIWDEIQKYLAEKAKEKIKGEIPEETKIMKEYRIVKNILISCDTIIEAGSFEEAYQKASDLWFDVHKVDVRGETDKVIDKVKPSCTELEGFEIIALK